MNKLTMITGSVTGAGIIALSGAGIAAAATKAPTTVNNSGIPRSIYREERQIAEAKVLDVSTSDLQTAHKNHTLKDLVSKAGLTEKTLHEKVNAQITSDLAAKGYTASQIARAEQHPQMMHHKHHADK